MPRVSVVTVSYECKADLLTMLGSLAECPSAAAVETLIADNASTDGTAEEISALYPDVKLIEVGYNSGFSVANNAAIAESVGEYVFLLNPDARVTPGCIDSLVRFMDSHPEVAAVGPKVLNPDMSLQYSIRNLPAIEVELFEALFLHRLFPGMTSDWGEMVVNKEAYRQARPVGWVSGAAMFVRRSAIEHVGVLDESFFLFCEEVDWFKRMHDAGLPVWFTPDAVVIHRDAKAVGSPRLAEIDTHSRRRYWAKHRTRFGAAVSALVLGLNLSLRYALWGVRALLGSETAAAKTAALGSALRALAPSAQLERPLPPEAALASEDDGGQRE